MLPEIILHFIIDDMPKLFQVIFSEKISCLKSIPLLVSVISQLRWSFLSKWTHVPLCWLILQVINWALQMRVGRMFVSLIVSQMLSYGYSEFSNVSCVSFNNLWFQVICPVHLDCQVYKQKYYLPIILLITTGSWGTTPLFFRWFC